MISLTASGGFSYAAALQVLESVAAKGAVSAADFRDLQTIAANLNNGITTSDPVAWIFTQLVDGNPANAEWNGGSATATTLGNLTIGSSATQLNELIGKWFLGTDLPDPTAAGRNSASPDLHPIYQDYSPLPLFGSAGVPQVTDVNQGDVGDCELCAGMVELALNHPAEIDSMFVSQGNGVYDVRFYVGGKAMWVTVNDQLPVYGGQLVYNDGPALWADLLEKGYAQLSATGLIQQAPVNSYTNISADYGYVVAENLNFTTAVEYFYSSATDWQGFKQAFINAVAAKDDVVLESYGATYDAFGNQQLIADHAFAVVGYDAATGDFIVRNPWGVEANQNYDTQFEISMADVVAVQGDFVIDNSSNYNVVISTLSNITSIGQTDSAGNLLPYGQYLPVNTAIAVKSLFAAMDVAGLPISEYMLQAVGSGSLQLNGALNLASAAQAAAGEIVVSASDLAKLSFTAGGSAGTTDLLISGYDGTSWSIASDIAVTQTTYPNAVVPQINAVLAPSSTISLASLFSVIGAAANGGTDYEFSPESGAGTIHLNGATNLLGTSSTGGVEVSAAQLADLTYTAPSSASSSSGFEVYVDATMFNGTTQISAMAQIPILVGTPVATALSEFNAGEIASWLSVTDSAANVAANLDALQTLVDTADISVISLTDSGNPVLTVTTAQATADSGVLNDIRDNFSVVQTATGSNLTISGVAAALGNTVAFSGDASQYSLTKTGDGVSFTVADGSGTDHLTDIQALQFADFTVIVAATPGSGTVTTGNITEIYAAVLDREPDVAGLAYYQNLLTANPSLPLATFALDFLQSPEYVAAHTYPQTSAGDTQFIVDSYQNLLGRTPAATETAYYQAVITKMLAGITPGTAAYSTAELDAHAAVLVDFSGSPEFLTDVQITGTVNKQHWLFLI